MKTIISSTIDPELAKKIIQEEEENFLKNKQVLGEIELIDEGDEIVVKSYPTSPIKRIRRITGYLSEEHNFNSSKQKELNDRKKHFLIS